MFQWTFDRPCAPDFRVSSVHETRCGADPPDTQDKVPSHLQKHLLDLLHLKPLPQESITDLREEMLKASAISPKVREDGRGGHSVR